MTEEERIPTTQYKGRSPSTSSFSSITPPACFDQPKILKSYRQPFFALHSFLSRLRSNSESDNFDREALLVRITRGNSPHCHNSRLAPANITVDIGPVYHLRSLYWKSWDLESPDRSESGSRVESPAMSPIETPPASPARSTTSNMSNQGSTQSEDEVMKEIDDTIQEIDGALDDAVQEMDDALCQMGGALDDAVQRTSDLREQLEMEKARSATLKKERDDAVLHSSHLQKQLEMEKVVGKAMKGRDDDTICYFMHANREGGKLEKRLLVMQAERDRAVQRKLESLAQVKQAEKEKDEAVKLSLETMDALEKRVKENEESQRLASRSLEQTNEARRLALESLEQIKQVQKRKHEAELRVADLVLENSLRASQTRKIEKERDEALQLAWERLERMQKMEKERDDTQNEVAALLWELANEKREKRGYWASLCSFFNLPNSWE
ncbi:hypothetical protein NHQ30_008983 [Ciborinia camelliae]|nr:hypothetical protein NHQ30_008983 [Ciborinia camelliae]